MKKKILIIVGMILFGACCFGQKFSAGGYAYVDASSGLRVRDDADLNARKIGVVYDRMKVKVIEVGPKVTIDGISSNWIRILLPVESLKEKNMVTGWVFGGYLTDKLKPFSTAGWTDQDLILYLSRYTWIYGERRFMHFTADGKLRFGLMETSAGGSGTYKVSMKNKTITATMTYGDDFQGWEKTEDEVYKIEWISEDKICLTSDGKSRELCPAIFVNDCYYQYLYGNDTDWLDIYFFHDSIYALFYEWSKSWINKVLRERREFTDTFYENLNEMCIDLGYEYGVDER